MSTLRFSLHVDLDNAAFDGDAAGYELSNILVTLAETVRGGPRSRDDLREWQRNLADTNGNRCGFALCELSLTA